MAGLHIQLDNAGSDCFELESAVLFLAARAPGGGAAPDGFTAQRSFVFGANSLGGPALVEEPIFRRIVEVGSYFFERFARYEANFLVKARAFHRFQFRTEAFGGEGGAPEDFVGHPIADSRKTFLVKERGFNGKPSVAGEEFGHAGDGEGA